MSNILIVQQTGPDTVDIRASLEPGGHQLLIAQSVEGAKTLLEAASFDLVICAAHLNNGTVFDLLNFVKRDPTRRKMPFVIVCCSQNDIAKAVDGTLRSTAMLLGADKCITQDVFDARELQIEVEAFLLERSAPCDKVVDTDQ